MAKQRRRKSLPGSLFRKNGGRWYWRVKLPGADAYTKIALIPRGARFATTERDTAEEVAQEILTQALHDVDPGHSDGSVAGLAHAYLRHIEQYHGDTTHAGNIKQAIARFRDQCGGVRVDDFGPKMLKEFRDYLIALKVSDDDERQRLSRSTINRYIGMIIKMFRWGVGEEIVPSSCWQALSAVEGLRKGKSDARETKVVRAVKEDDVLAVAEHASGVIGDMLRLQLYTGMRSTELCSIRRCDLDVSGDVWEYNAPSKSEHLGYDRIVRLGPKAQAILEPYLLKFDDQAYLFQPSTAPHSVAVRERYDKNSYRRAVMYAIRKTRKALKEKKSDVTVADFTPHQIRHTAATLARKEFGLDAARAMLGHRSVSVTDDYAELDRTKAIEVARQIG